MGGPVLYGGTSYNAPAPTVTVNPAPVTLSTGSVTQNSNTNVKVPVTTNTTFDPTISTTVNMPNTAGGQLLSQLITPPPFASLISPTAPTYGQMLMPQAPHQMSIPLPAPVQQSAIPFAQRPMGSPSGMPLMMPPQQAPNGAPAGMSPLNPSALAPGNMGNTLAQALRGPAGPGGVGMGGPQMNIPPLMAQGRPNPAMMGPGSPTPAIAQGYSPGPFQGGFPGAPPAGYRGMASDASAPAGDGSGQLLPGQPQADDGTGQPQQLALTPNIAPKSMADLLKDAETRKAEDEQAKLDKEEPKAAQDWEDIVHQAKQHGLNGQAILGRYKDQIADVNNKFGPNGPYRSAIDEAKRQATDAQDKSDQLRAEIDGLRNGLPFALARREAFAANALGGFDSPRYQAFKDAMGMGGPPPQAPVNLQGGTSKPGALASGLKIGKAIGEELSHRMYRTGMAGMGYGPNTSDPRYRMAALQMRQAQLAQRMPDKALEDTIKLHDDAVRNYEPRLRAEHAQAQADAKNAQLNYKNAVDGTRKDYKDALLEAKREADTRFASLKPEAQSIGEQQRATTIADNRNNKKIEHGLRQDSNNIARINAGANVLKARSAATSAATGEARENRQQRMEPIVGAEMKAKTGYYNKGSGSALPAGIAKPAAATALTPEKAAEIWKKRHGSLPSYYKGG